MRAPSILRFALAGAATLALAACGAGRLIGGMQQNFEYEKQLDVPAAYDGLAGHTVAVIVDVDASVMYEHPGVALNIATGVVDQLREHVPDALVVDGRASYAWQVETPGWNALSFGDMARNLSGWLVRRNGQANEALLVDRVVLIDVYEYRLNPPGNRYEWDGVCAANIRVIECDDEAIDPDWPVKEWDVAARFPDLEGVGRESATEDRIALGVLAKFVRETTWLFYRHLEDKYPGKRRTGTNA